MAEVRQPALPVHLYVHPPRQENPVHEHGVWPVERVERLGRSGVAPAAVPTPIKITSTLLPSSNEFYRSEPALYTQDFDQAGFDVGRLQRQPPPAWCRSFAR